MNTIVPRMMTMLARWETAQLKAYRDGPTWSVGYGHNNANNYPPFVDENTVLKDEAEAMSILVGELNEHYVPQLNALLSKFNITVNDNEFSALLDVGYNRGMGRLRDSKAFDWLKQPTVKYYKERCAEALVNSHVEGFTPLNTNAHGEIKLGLTLRRIDDASLFLSRD